MNLQLFITFLLGVMPVSEVRGAILYGIGVELPTWEVFLIGTLGSFVPIIPLLYGLEFVSQWLSKRSYFFNRFFAWLFEKTHRDHHDYFTKWGQLGLLIFVAIPLPMTGVWTGTLAAFLFGFPRIRSLLIIGLGSMIAGLISLGAATSFFTLLRLTS